MLVLNKKFNHPLKEFLILFLALLLQSGPGYSRQKPAPLKYSAYLFAYFTGNGAGEESIHFALSNDGFTYRALNENRPVLYNAEISASGGVRDPHILRGADGKTFYMVATDMNVAKNGWGPNYAMVLMKSKNLVDWTTQSVNIPQSFPELKDINRVWAPQTIYDPKARKYMIYWAMRSGNDPDKIFYAYANKDFTGLETKPKQLLFNPDSTSCIDADIVLKDGRYNLFFKTEGQSQKGIKKAVSFRLTTGYVVENKYLQRTNQPVEGSCTFKLNNSDDWILMYDMYMSGRYQFTKSKDLENFVVVDNEISMDFHPRHGTVMGITAAEAQALATRWRSAADPMIYGSSTGATEDKGAGGTTASGNHNPVLKGYYADPEILYAEKTRKFYIYPTTDGFDNWSGTYFKAFSSTDLVKWKDEGVILDLKNVTWAKRNAWAPCIIEKKIGAGYKYFYYFAAAQKIGVAVSDSPTGPFIDSGKPLIDQYPEGVDKGQQIDPDVFTDPKTGKTYLYWGNAYLAGAELNDDMISIKKSTTRILTPDNTYNEGSYVFYRKGIYYFMWSQNDTRSEDYCVRYGTSDNPLGKITVSQHNLVIAKNPALGIYATGHNAVLQLPGKDQWYLVYHRFAYPQGITMGAAAGYHREVCIDKMEFNADSSIKQVIPTHEGVQSVKLN
jgi:arabinoxylan arabinofuranohydrolase